MREVFLADTTGELMGLFGIASAVFVGKSLCEHGSQNMIEPCLCGVPTAVGPYTENFRPVMSDLLSANALIQVADAAELAEFFKATFASPDADAEMSRRVSGIGERAALAVARRRGACGNCAADILSRIS
jgi:3-deoxy-D-manno-octulosonic-acid transferase